MEQIIRELSLRLLNIISEQNGELGELLSDPNNIELIEESIEVLTDESLKILDDYIASIDTDNNDN
jgi:hypothetical protein